MLNALFIESKENLYRYVDAAERDNWPEQLSKRVKAQIRKWLGEKFAPPDEVIALVHEMGMSDDLSKDFTTQLSNSLELLQSKFEEDNQAEDTTPRSRSSQSFSLAEEMRRHTQLEKHEITQQVLAYQDRLKAEKKLSEPGLVINKSERRRLSLIVENGKMAEESLIATCWNLIKFHVGNCPGNNVPEDDLIQESVLGVIRAMESYDPQKSAFSTYATYWIRKAITTAAATQARSIPLPENTANLIKKIRRASAEHESRTGTLPGEQEVAQIIGCSVKRIHNATRNERQSQSISMETVIAGESDNFRILDSIRDPNAEAQFDRVLEQTQEVDVRKLITSTLLPMEEIVILLSFGFEDGQAKPMNDIGTVLGYTKENIRQIKLRATAKLGDQKCLEELDAAS